MHIEKTIETTLLLRFDTYEKLFDNFKNNQLIFSCPANWLNLALKNYYSPEKDIYKDNVGDLLECVFAKIYTQDFVPDRYVDHYGKPLGRNLFVLKTQTGKSFLFHQQLLLTPALCFYSINGKDIFNNNPNFNYIEFQIQQFAYYYFGCSDFSNKGVLVIFNPNEFFEDLELHINSALKAYGSRLTKKYYYQPLPNQNGNGFLAQNVQYCSFYENDTFNVANDTFDEIFYKSKKFEDQSEARIVIPNINFKERLENIQDYKYQVNELPINLPKLHTYARLLKVEEIKSIPIFKNGLLNLKYWNNLK